MKTCIIMGISNIGKTSTIKHIANLYDEKKAKCIFLKNINNNQDIIKVYTDNNHTIGLISIGDNVYEIENAFKKIKNSNVDYLICASKSYGQTVEYLESLSERTIKIFKPYFIDDNKKQKNVLINDNMNRFFANYVYTNLYDFFN